MRSCVRCGAAADRTVSGALLCASCASDPSPPPRASSSSPRAPARAAHNVTEKETLPPLTATSSPSSLVPNPSYQEAEAGGPESEVELLLAEWADGSAIPSRSSFRRYQRPRGEGAARRRPLPGRARPASRRLDNRAIPFACGWVGEKPRSSTRSRKIAKRRREPPGAVLPPSPSGESSSGSMRTPSSFGGALRREEAQPAPDGPMGAWSAPLEAGSVEAPRGVVDDPAEPESELSDEALVPGREWDQHVLVTAEHRADGTSQPVRRRRRERPQARPHLCGDPRHERLRGRRSGLARPSQETLRAAEEPADRICCSLLAPRYTCEHSEPLPPTAQRGRCPGRSAT